MKILKSVVLGLVVLAVICGGVFYRWPLWVIDQQLHIKLWQMGVHSDYVDTSLGRLHYFDTGAAGVKEPVPVLLVHGLADRVETWTPVMMRLKAQGFRVYAVDLLGYGRSATPDSDYSISTEVKAVSEFMDATRMGQADVVGWSMGGWTAAKLTLDHPEKVRRLVLFDAAGIRFSPVPSTEDFIPKNADEVYTFIKLLLAKPANLPRFVAADAARRLVDKGWVTRRSMASMTSGVDLLDDRLAAMPKPMLLVWGKEDRLTPLSEGETMHRLDGASHLVVIDGCGHGGPTECAATYERVSAEFFKAPVAVAGGQEEIVEDKK